LQGDITEAYSKKVRQVTRSFVFLNLREAQTPGALVVFDRVVAARGDFRKYWLLHTLEEPVLEGASARVDCTQHGASGRLNLDVLLPRPPNAVLSKVGGRGKEYWVFGTNYANDAQPERVSRGSIETSDWRLELSPQSAAAEDHFLAVMQMSDRRESNRFPVRSVEFGEHTGCLIAGKKCSWMVLFRRDTARSTEPVELTVSGAAPARVLVTDLAAGRWRLQRTGSSESQTLEVADDSGAAWFEASAGTWTLGKL
jgi:heparin/heparan-sulfate lyase